MDADDTLDETREQEVRAPEPNGSRQRIFDESFELEPRLRSTLEESEHPAGDAGTESKRKSRARRQRGVNARLTWLEEQLEVRDEAIRQRVPGWRPGDLAIPPEEAVVLAFDEIMSEHAREMSAAAVARKHAKEAHSKGVEAGAVGAVVVLGLLASGVALVYAAWDVFFG